MEFDFKSLCAIAATTINLVAFYPYIRDVLRKKTQPHLYTWLLWVITQTIAVIGIWYGGGQWGAVTLTSTLLLVFCVFLLCFKYGTRNVTRFDTVLLVVALAAVGIWWMLEEAALAVVFATAIDLAGYIPTLRKTFEEPWSETMGVWLTFSIANTLSIAALSTYNVFTLTYLAGILVANICVAALCFFRRKVVLKPH
jgi:hypothetical protein